MRQTIRLGTIAGIRIGANLGVLVIVAIIVFGLAAARYPAVQPGRSLFAYVVAAVITAVLFLASLLAHELAHALVAQANGVRVEAITLWLFGGVSVLRGEVKTPAADFAVAGVGPATSLALGALFAGITAGLSAAGADGLAVQSALYLAVINIILGLFNLLPAAPLDGGRVLRAAVWKGTGDRTRAAVIAARAGRVLGFTLIALGIVVALGTGTFSGLWWSLIGWFLVQAAGAEEQQARVTQQLSGVRVADVMSSQPVRANPDDTLSGFIPTVATRHRFSTYPLTDPAGRLAGLVTVNRIRAVPLEARESTRLADVACPPEDVPTARADEPLSEVLARLDGCTDGRAVVVDEAQRVVGVLSPSDIDRTVNQSETGRPERAQPLGWRGFGGWRGAGNRAGQPGPHEAGPDQPGPQAGPDQPGRPPAGPDQPGPNQPPPGSR